MTSLAELDASNNRLTQVPMTLGDCAGLRALDLSNNQLGLLPLREFKYTLRNFISRKDESLIATQSLAVIRYSYALNRVKPFRNNNNVVCVCMLPYASNISSQYLDFKRIGLFEFHSDSTLL